MSPLLDFMLTDISKRDLHAGSRLLWRVGVILFIFYAMGWLGLGAGFVRADEMQQKILLASAPINVAIANLTDAVHKQGAEAREQTLRALRAAIVDDQVKRCRSPKSETAAIYRQLLLDAQSRYYSLTNQVYPAPSCADL